jgi:hypothetical protein
MTREELAAVRDVIDALLRCPDHVRELLTQWIAPQARWLAPQARSKERTVPLIFSKPNGRDPHPPQAASTGKASEETDGFSPRRSPTPYAGKARHRRPPISAKAAEQQLMATLRDNPGASVNALAKAPARPALAACGHARRTFRAASCVFVRTLLGTWAGRSTPSQSSPVKSQMGAA